MTRASSHKQWKGCRLCSPHKHHGNGDTVRAPWAVNRKIGKKRRWTRNTVTQEEKEA